MAVIIPAILEDNLEGFADKLAAILKVPNVARVQIDFSDGIFTPRRTLEISDLDVLSPAYFWEAHLMVQNPSQHFLDAKIAGFNCLVLHFEAVADKQQLAQMAAAIREYKMSPGLAINPETDVSAIFPYTKDFDQVLVLSVHPGYQGQQFLEETFQRVAALKQHDPTLKIEVDGAVKPSNIKRLVETGADLLVVGSAMYASAAGSSAAAAQPEKTLAEIATENFERLQAELQK